MTSTSPVILIVESPEIRRLIRLMLERTECTVIESNEENASHLLQARQQEVDLLITNHPEPFLEIRPDLRILYLAGLPEVHIAWQCSAVLLKPFACSSLLASVDELLRAENRVQVNGRSGC